MHRLASPLALFALLALLAASCFPAAAEDGSWHVDVALSASAKLGGCAVGDFDTQRPGHEIAAVSITGEVFLVWRETVVEGEGDEAREIHVWKHEVIATTPGELIQCRAGDAYPEIAGDELLVFGMKVGTEDDGGEGAAYLLSRPDGEWRLEPVLHDSALLHAGCIGDVDPRTPGPEILLAGFSRQAFVLHRVDGAWVPTTVAPLEGEAKNAVAFQGGAAIGCGNGQLVHVQPDASPDNEGWSVLVLDEAEAGQSRLGVLGEKLIVARDDGVLAIVQAGRNTEVHREPSKLRGAVLAELDPHHAGPEAASAGYEKKLVVLTREGGEWTPEVIHTETHRFHHLTSGELMAESPGEELVACGYSGRLLVAWISGTVEDE